MGRHENHEIWEFANQVGYIYKQQDGSHENHSGSGMGCHCMARNRWKYGVFKPSPIYLSKNGLYEWDGMKTLKNKFCEPDVHEIYRYIEWMG